MKARLPLVAALVVTLAPVSAFAQAWVNSPDFSEGVGIRTGNLEWHPSLGAEFGYDSNLFRESKAEVPVDVYRLRVTPSFTVGTLGGVRRNAATPPNVVFAAGAHAAYNEFIAADSENSDISKRRNLGAGVDAKVNVFPARKVGFDVLGNYRRTIQAAGSSEDLAGEGFNRNSLRGGAGITWRPGGGLFEWRGGYTATYNFFESDAFIPLNNLHHEIGTRGRWRFLPRSALLFDTSYTFVRYTDDNSPQTDGDILRSKLGFHGLVTYNLALLGMIGWASTFYEQGPATIGARQFDSIIANAEARWFIQKRPDLDEATVVSGLSSVALGYSRTVSNSYFGSFYQRDRGYLQFSAFVVGAVAAGLEFGVSRVGYPEVQRGMIDQPAVSQLRIDSQVFAEYRFTDTLAANATFLYDHVSSGVVAGEDLSFRRCQAYLGLRWFM